MSTTEPLSKASSYIRALVLSGGGVKGFGHLGVLHYYYTKGMMSHDRLEEVACTSIGAVVGLLLVCGYTPQEIYNSIYTHNPLTSVGSSLTGSFLSSTFGSIFKGYGIIDISHAFILIETLVKDKFGYIPTLEKLYELSGISLKITVSNITKKRVEYLSHTTDPELLVTEAVKMSCSLPPVCQKIVYNQCSYVDGGLVDNFPYQALENKTNVLGSVVFSSDDTNVGSEDSFINYMYRVVSLPVDTITKLRVAEAERNHGIKIVKVRLDVSPIDFNINVDKKAQMFRKGYIDAKAIESKRSLNIMDWAWDDVWEDNFDFAIDGK